MPDFCKLTEPKDLEYKFKPGTHYSCLFYIFNTVSPYIFVFSSFYFHVLIWQYETDSFEIKLQNRRFDESAEAEDDQIRGARVDGREPLSHWQSGRIGQDDWRATSTNINNIHCLFTSVICLS